MLSKGHLQNKICVQGLQKFSTINKTSSTGMFFTDRMSFILLHLLHDYTPSLSMSAFQPHFETI